MNRFLTALLLCAAATACSQVALISPQEVILIVETNIVLSEHDATVAVRVRNRDPQEALVHVACEGTDETLIARLFERTEESCGLQFELASFRIDEGEVNAVVLKLHFDDGRESDLPLGEGSGSGSGSGTAPADEATQDMPTTAPLAIEPVAVEPPAVEPAAAPTSQATPPGVTTTQPSAGLIAGEGSGSGTAAAE
ncbi:MAG: hypothetical protein ACI81R_001518 [Bradymonadia bacterium]|jgi:hypothetical protein